MEDMGKNELWPFRVLFAPEWRSTRVSTAAAIAGVRICSGWTFASEHSSPKLLPKRGWDFGLEFLTSPRPETEVKVAADDANGKAMNDL